MKLKRILENDPSFGDRFIPDYEVLGRVVETLKEMGYRVVLTQGVYDQIHEGHINYLQKAKEMGDILVVGVDSDELTQRRKGPDRPIDDEQYRLRTLVNLRSVDIVTLRHADNDLDYLTEVVQPNILVLSQTTEDFTKEKAEKKLGEVCGEIVVLEAQAATSTTARIRKMAVMGADEFRETFLGKTEELLSSEELRDVLSELLKKFSDKVFTELFHPEKERNR